MRPPAARAPASRGVAARHHRGHAAVRGPTGYNDVRPAGPGRPVSLVHALAARAQPPRWKMLAICPLLSLVQPPLLPPLGGWPVLCRTLPGYWCIANDRRGRGRPSQPWGGNEMDTYAGDLAALVETLDLKDAVPVGRSTGAGEALSIDRHDTRRVPKAVLVGAVPPLMGHLRGRQGRHAEGLSRRAARPVLDPQGPGKRGSPGLSKA